MMKKEQFYKQKVYENMIRTDANMSSFNRAPYHTAAVSNQKVRSCMLEFPCSLGDTVYELYGQNMIPLIVTGFLVTQADSYILAVEKRNSSLEKMIVLGNVYLSPEGARGTMKNCNRKVKVKKYE